MVRLIIRHDVIDYETWRTRFDEFYASGAPAERGVRGHSVYQDETDPNNVTVTFDFDDGETAEAYVMDPDNKRMLEAGGVKPGGLLMSIVDDV